MTHAVTQAEVEKALELAGNATRGPWESVGLRIYRAGTRRYAEDETCIVHSIQDSRLITASRELVPAMAERINQMEKAMESALFDIETGNARVAKSVLRSNLADYRQDALREQTCSHND